MMDNLLHRARDAGVLLAIIMASAVQGATPDTLKLGDAESEAVHKVVAEHTEIVGYVYPDNWVMAARASGFHKGHEPHQALDGKPDTHWEISGHPQAPMVRGHWLEVDLNRSIKLEEVSIQWLGDKPYDFQIQDKPFEDLRQVRHSGKSRGQSTELEIYRVAEPRETRAIRIEFAVDPAAGPQGIKEVRINGLKWPDGYPPAAHAGAPVEIVRRPYYVEFERMLTWPVFSLKRPLADGGKSRRVLPRDDAFEGGWIDFDIAVDPKEPIWITLRLWGSEAKRTDEWGNAIIVQTLDGAAGKPGRSFLPRFVTEEQNWQFEWYGKKPQPGRWVYASYALPKDLTNGKTSIRLRLQGVGNARRDHPMRAASPPVYVITSDTRPAID
ncbi:MAG: discoidin domain-containing protein [Burkholderiales bacterium]|nr:discoidin domain-containing protein [Phycisphaerae bacterium]